MDKKKFFCYVEDRRKFYFYDVSLVLSKLLYRYDYIACHDYDHCICFSYNEDYVDSDDERNMKKDLQKLKRIILTLGLSEVNFEDFVRMDKFFLFNYNKEIDDQIKELELEKIKETH